MQRDSTPIFVTFNTKLRRTLPNWARDIVLRSCLHDHDKCYRLRVAVVMPDHVHLVLTPLVDQVKQEIISLVTILQAIKSASSHFINKRSGSNQAIWQEESFDRIVRSSESLDAKIAYIMENPVRKGLVDDWRDYPWIWREPEQNPCAEPK
jgi:REP element-mobilizing transposase RayT